MQLYTMTYSNGTETDPREFSIGIDQEYPDDPTYDFDAGQLALADGTSGDDPLDVYTCAQQFAHFVAQNFLMIFQVNTVVWNNCKVENVDDDTATAVEQFDFDFQALSRSEVLPVRGVGKQVAGIRGRVANSNAVRPYFVGFLSNDLTAINPKQGWNTLASPTQTSLARLKYYITLGVTSLRTVSDAQEVDPVVVNVVMDWHNIFHTTRRRR